MKATDCSSKNCQYCINLGKKTHKKGVMSDEEFNCLNKLMKIVVLVVKWMIELISNILFEFLI